MSELLKALTEQCAVENNESMIRIREWMEQA